MNGSCTKQVSICEHLTFATKTVPCISDDNLNEKFKNYNTSQYFADLDNLGLEQTWDCICAYLLTNGEHDGILCCSNLGDLYEMGLEHKDKQSKKDKGQYYTSQDVCVLMSQWLDELEADNICDVACGTGNLILSYFDYIGREKTKNILGQGKLYLYDNDVTALKICKTILLLKYGKDYDTTIHTVCGDFLNSDIKLPHNCKVIANPPYSKISKVSDTWAFSDIINDTQEYYAAFYEKILKQARNAVIISPYSFLGAEKYYRLRELMNSYNGYIVSFDNVPGNIFAGKKRGIFNSNTANSVRAAITVVENKPDCHGFRLSPLIRFKQTEREQLLTSEVLKATLSDRYQIITAEQDKYLKCDKNLEAVYDSWTNNSTKLIADYVVSEGKYSLYIPTTCRYYTVASHKKLSRKGQMLLRFDDEMVYSFVFCLINSSFAYWYWRLYDGGITFTKNLLQSMPTFYDILTDDDKRFFFHIFKQMTENTEQFIRSKSNVGIQQNIKYPKEYRDTINQKFLDILGIDKRSSIFDKVHSNMALKVNVL